MRIVLALVAALAIGLTGCTGDDAAMGDTQLTDPASAPLSRTEIQACLEAAGATLSGVRPSDAQLRALRDLAQGRSVAVRTEDGVLYLAFARDVAEAELLRELLAVPGGEYEVERNENAIVLYRQDDDQGLRVVVDCLEG